jgi:hypothetical protein
VDFSDVKSFTSGASRDVGLAVWLNNQRNFSPC